jgi:hypothetical protein
VRGRGLLARGRAVRGDPVARGADDRRRRGAQRPRLRLGALGGHGHPRARERPEARVFGGDGDAQQGALRLGRELRQRLAVVGEVGVRQVDPGRARRGDQSRAQLHEAVAHRGHREALRLGAGAVELDHARVDRVFVADVDGVGERVAVLVRQVVDDELHVDGHGARERAGDEGRGRRADARSGPGGAGAVGVQGHHGLARGRARVGAHALGRAGGDRGDVPARRGFRGRRDADRGRRLPIGRGFGLGLGACDPKGRKEFACS